ncbi:hypothetical protein [Hansschlegelia zhihuaiae]|uniref:Uncharacterized protein n=1 Tax=Hansschlegelia zhihuaiae TaxID=405005 RepID=A0A4Q0MMV3_9HYPH|nr:hypothetical protein [Hansschlegelia zhihuaiae]RXF75064.1 hypothetical protein EK403_03175 [Hansschlegelia zhihuaiae]
MTLQGSKSKKSSLTIWAGALGALVGIGGGALGLTVTEADVSELVGAGAAIFAGVGGVIAVIGRIRATKTVR